jgi:hypothetical protein
MVVRCMLPDPDAMSPPQQTTARKEMVLEDGSCKVQ